MQTTIYIRKDNEDHWNSIEDKSRWVNDKLVEKTGTLVELETKSDGTVTVMKETPYVRGDLPKEPKKAPKYGTLKDLIESGQAEVVEAEMTGLPDLLLPKAQKVKGDHCPHGFNLKVSKCKYGCK